MLKGTKSMENNNKGMFTGFSKVFGFTAAQNVKGRGFKLSTILLALIIGAVFALISVVMAVSQKDDGEEGKDINSIIGIEDAMDIDVYYINNSTFGDDVIEGITEAEALKESSLVKVEEEQEKTAVNDTNSYLEGKKNSLVMNIEEDEEKIEINYYLPYNSDIDSDTADTLGEVFTEYLDYVRSGNLTNLSDRQRELYNTEVIFSQALAAGEEAPDFGVMLAKLIVPMIFSLALYMMILLYGQNITKVVVSEKSSKLMETLLTSVKPYAIISGKIMAVSGIAIMQILIWTGAGVLGYVIGENIADMISSSSDAFSAGAIIIALVMTIIGFLMYCVAAGLVAATVDKMEDISSAMSLFQVPVIVGFIGAYFAPMSGNDTLNFIVRYCPVTSPFCVPAEIMVGNISILEGIIFLAIVAAVTFGLILLTGRIYKGKLFNRH